MAVDSLKDLHAALVEEVRAGDTLVLLDESPPEETGSPSITVGEEIGEETPRLSLTLEPESGQVVLRGAYWRSGELTPGMRERHGLLFPPVTFRLYADGYGLSDPRRAIPPGESVEVERFGTAGEAAGFLFGLLEHFYGEVADRSD